MENTILDQNCRWLSQITSEQLYTPGESQKMYDDWNIDR